MKASLVVHITADGSFQLRTDGATVTPATSQTPPSSSIADIGIRRRTRATKTVSDRQGVSSAVSEDRTIETELVRGESSLREQAARNEIRHTFHAMPTPALRAASDSFELAVRAAVETANAARSAETALENWRCLQLGAEHVCVPHEDASADRLHC
jgi:hypothetical protein